MYWALKPIQYCRLICIRTAVIHLDGGHSKANVTNIGHTVTVQSKQYMYTNINGYSDEWDAYGYGHRHCKRYRRYFRYVHSRGSILSPHRDWI